MLKPREQGQQRPRSSVIGVGRKDMDGWKGIRTLCPGVIESLQDLIRFQQPRLVDDDERHSSAIRTRPCTSSNMQMSAESWPDCRHLPEQRQERRKKIHRTHRQLKLNSIAIQNFISESI